MILHKPKGAEECNKHCNQRSIRQNLPSVNCKWGCRRMLLLTPRKIDQDGGSRRWSGISPTAARFLIKILPMCQTLQCIGLSITVSFLKATAWSDMRTVANATSRLTTSRFLILASLHLSNCHSSLLLRCSYPPNTTIHIHEQKKQDKRLTIITIKMMI